MITRFYNARLIDALDETPRGELYVENGRICAPCESDRAFDLRGKALMPALVDMHTHLRDPGYAQKETMESGMRAAIAGGYGALAAMANTNPVIRTPEQVLQNLKKSRALGLCTLVQAAAAGDALGDETATDYAALSRVTKLISNDGKTIFNDDFMRALLLASKEYGFLISTHCQPEREIVARDIRLLRETQGRLHIGHISTKETLDMVRRAKDEGLELSCEVTPHHLFGFESDYKVNPPLRTREDVKALIGGIKEGVIDVLSTDHAPHTREDKRAGMAGISNIDYALKIYLRVFEENGIPLTRLCEMTSRKSAELLSLEPRTLEIGRPADLIVVDTERKSTIKSKEMRSRSHNTPFLGRVVRGEVLLTMLRGELLFESETWKTMLAEPQKKTDTE